MSKWGGWCRNVDGYVWLMSEGALLSKKRKDVPLVDLAATASERPAFRIESRDDLM